jgi:magnesium-transporting ATPase (P-type)
VCVIQGNSSSSSPSPLPSVVHRSSSNNLSPNHRVRESSAATRVQVQAKPTATPSASIHQSVNPSNIHMTEHNTNQIALEKPLAAASPTNNSNTKRTGDRWFRHSQGTVEYEKLPTGKDPSYAHSSNKVITSKYTLLTFLPHNLFEQFQNLANIYFLFVGILQIIPQISTTNGNPTMYQPLAFIVFVSAVRAAKEDYDKHKADAKRNGYPYQVSRAGKSNESFVEVESGDIRVGDIVKVKQNDMVPADMLFLGSALPKGHCFIVKLNITFNTQQRLSKLWLITNRPILFYFELAPLCRINRI